MSPTQRSLAYLRKQGYVCQIVEHWNAFAKRRVDLFGVIDIVCLGGSILGVQTTTGDNLSKRVQKMLDEPNVISWLRAGGMLVAHGWSKKGPRGKAKRWAVREVRIELSIGTSREGLIPLAIEVEP